MRQFCNWRAGSTLNLASALQASVPPDNVRVDTLSRVLTTSFCDYWNMSTLGGSSRAATAAVAFSVAAL